MGAFSAKYPIVGPNFPSRKATKADAMVLRLSLCRSRANVRVTASRVHAPSTSRANLGVFGTGDKPFEHKVRDNKYKIYGKTVHKTHSPNDLASWGTRRVGAKSV